MPKSKILLIIIGFIAVAALSGVGVFYWATQNAKKEKQNLEQQISDKEKEIKELEEKAKDAESNGGKTDLKTLTNKKESYSAKYPKDWFVKNCDDTFVGFAPTQKRLPPCNSEGDAPITVSVQEGVSVTDISYKSSDLTKYKKETIKVDGVSATKVTGEIKETGEVGPEKGTKVIQVVLSKSGGSIIIAYWQHKTDTDETAVFEEFLKNFKFE